MSESEEFAKDLRGGSLGRHLLNAAGLLVAVGLVTLIGYELTSPWPAKGPGGGEGKNLMGPVLTGLAVMITTVLYVFVAYKRRRRS